MTNKVLFKKSPFLKVLGGKDKSILYHSLNGNPTLVGNDLILFLKNIDKPFTLFDFKKLKNDQISTIADLLDLNFLIENDKDERELFIKKLSDESKNRSLFSNGLVLTLTTKCNYACTYCIAERNIGDIGVLDCKIAIETIDNYIKTCKSINPSFTSFNLVLTGGEALLNWHDIENIIKHNKKIHNNITIKYRIITNGSLVTKNIAKQLKDISCDVIISVDGEKKIHDLNRKFKNGKGTWHSTWKGLSLLSKEDCSISISAVYNQNSNMAFSDKLLKRLSEMKISNITINIDNLSLLKEETKVVGKKLIDLRCRAKKFNIEVGGMWTIPIKNMWDNKRDISLCSASSRGGIYVTPDKQIRFCEYHNKILGSIDNMGKVWDEYTNKENPYLFGKWQECTNCQLEGFCSPCVLEKESLGEQYNTFQKKKCNLFKYCTNEIIKEKLGTY
ncbi:MAG: radical SAM protein [Arcobacteraceae bacterium]|nr:radical SAM protein [Arcobacteraceae bacterium]